MGSYQYAVYASASVAEGAAPNGGAPAPGWGGALPSGGGGGGCSPGGGGGGAAPGCGGAYPCEEVHRLVDQNTIYNTCDSQAGVRNKLKDQTTQNCSTADLKRVARGMVRKGQNQGYTYGIGTIGGVLHLRLVKFHLLLLEHRLHFCVFISDDFQQVFSEHLGTSDLAIIWSSAKWQVLNCYGWEGKTRQTHVTWMYIGSSCS